MGVRQSVLDYMDYATIHGVGRVKNSPYIVLKVLWGLLVCASLGIIFWQIYELHEKYQSAPVSTSVEVKTAEKLDFPDITICNNNPAMYSKLGHDSELFKLIEESSKKYSIDLSLYNNTDDLYEYNYTSVDSHTENKDVDDDILSATANKFKMLLSITSEETLADISQNMSDLILMCTFYGLKCSPDMFLPLRTFDYGQCFSFNVFSDPRLDQGRTSVSGVDNSLELLLYINQGDTLPFVSSSTGIIIQPDIGGGMFDVAKSVFIPTGFEANIGISLVKYDSVPGKDPASPRCNKNLEEESLADCLVYCKQDFIFENCNCYQYYFLFGEVNSSIPLNKTFDPYFGYRPCYTDADYECIIEVLEAFVLLQPDDCKRCVPHCQRTEFQKDVSMFTWPNERFIPILRRIMQAKASDSGSLESFNREFVRNNLALVRVYLKSLTYEVVKEEYSYSEVDFISDVGGQLGLWAGFSVLSLLELIELIVIVIARARKNDVDDKETEIAAMK